jgi:hypothetical protein
MLRLLLLPFMICIMGTALASEVVWHDTVAYLQPDLSSNRSIANFSFKVPEDSGKVVITVSEKSCGCTHAGQDKNIYKGGDTGTISFTFDYGSRTGAQKKTATILEKYPDGSEKETTLTMFVTIPETLEISQRLVTWQAGEESETRTVSLIRLQDFDFTITDIQHPDAFDVTAEQVDDSTTLLHIVPRSTPPAHARIDIIAETPVARHQNLVIHAMNRNAAAMNRSKAPTEPQEPWSAKTIRKEPAIDQVEESATFVFTNTDPNLPATILDYRTRSVGTITMENTDPMVPPGDSRTFTFVVPVRSTGSAVNDRATILIQTGDHRPRSHQLVLQTESPDIIDFKKRTVMWKSSPEESYKAIRVPLSLPEDADFQISGLEFPEGASFEVDLVREDGSSYDGTGDPPTAFVATPHPGTIKAIERVFVTTDHPAERYRRIPLRLVVY